MYIIPNGIKRMSVTAGSDMQSKIIFVTEYLEGLSGCSKVDALKQMWEMALKTNDNGIIQAMLNTIYQLYPNLAFVSGFVGGNVSLIGSATVGDDIIKENMALIGSASVGDDITKDNLPRIGDNSKITPTSSPIKKKLKYTLDPSSSQSSGVYQF